MTDSTPKKATADVRPSSSLLLLDPLNRILLVQRSTESTMSFSSAHVFPGGNLDSSQDIIPNNIVSTLCPTDALQYQLKICAIRETFEETGVLLLREKRTGLLKLAEELIDPTILGEARKKIYTGDLKFLEFLETNGADIPIEELLPFTTWITPKSYPKRYHTQMFLSFLPKVHPAFLSEDMVAHSTSSEKKLPIPNMGEISNVTFLPPHTALALNKEGGLILFPPQFYLLTQITWTVASIISKVESPATMQTKHIEIKNALVELSGKAFGKRVIQPYVRMILEDGRVCLALGKSGSLRDRFIESTSDKACVDLPVEDMGDRENLLLVRWSNVIEERKTANPRAPVPSQLELVNVIEFLERLKKDKSSL